MKEECKYCSGWNDEKAECIGIGMYCATHEQIEEEAAQARITDLNSIPVEDWDCDGDEILYIHVSNEAVNRKILTDLGATETDLDNMAIGTDGLLDITLFAFEHTDAEWWKHDIGFGKGDMPD